MSKSIYLTCKRVRYNSIIEEHFFFECLYKIKSITNIEGAGDELYIDFKGKKISDYAFKGLIGLFFRYKVNIKQLQIFINKKNEKWVKNKKAYWYKKMFDN